MPKTGRGRPVRSQTREIVYNVKKYFEEEKSSGRPLRSLGQVTGRVSDATGLGLTTVRAICREGDSAIAEGRPFPGDTPGKNRPRCKVILDPDSFTLEAIRLKIHSFYLNGQIPSLLSLHKSLLEDSNENSDTNAVFAGSVEALRQIIINKLGFRYKKVDSRKHLLERTDVVALRHTYLREMRNVDLENGVVFLDETWVNDHHTVSSCWQSPDCNGVKKPTGKGKRLILLHAGTANGFVPNCLLLFRSKSGLADYHQDMNAEVFKRWFEFQLLPNIPSTSIIVMDNASYHSVQLDRAPVSNSLKKDMQYWLRENQIPFDERMLKAELYEIIKLHKPSRKRYEIDELAFNHGHRVVRLPPYHCQFNPIELIWAQVKGAVAKQNSKFNLTEVEALTEKIIKTVTTENWLKAVRNTKKTMNTYWENDGLIESKIEPLIVSINGNESDSESDCSEESYEQFQSAFETLEEECAIRSVFSSPL